MAAPDKTRNSRVFPLTEKIWLPDPTMPTIPQENSSTTMVRTAVATVESVFRIPHFARIEVMPAKKAEPAA